MELLFRHKDGEPTKFIAEGSLVEIAAAFGEAIQCAYSSMCGVDKGGMAEAFRHTMITGICDPRSPAWNPKDRGETVSMVVPKKTGGGAKP